MIQLQSINFALLFGAALAVAAPVQTSAKEAENAALIAQGENLFKSQCAACHEIGSGAKNKVGPHLDLIVGRKAGVVPEFRYSKAIVDAGANGLVWDSAGIDEYVERPRDFIAGNRMSYRGMAKAEDRAALIAYIAKASDTLPTDNLSQSASASTSAAPGFTEEILMIEGDVAFGEYLAGECVTCHQVSGRVDGLPSIVGIPKDYFVRALVEYKTNVRSNEVMRTRLANLGNEEIAALAAYFGGLEPQ